MYSQAFTPEALAAFQTSRLEVRLRGVRPKGSREASVEVALIHRCKPGDFSPQVVPVPVELVVGLVRIRRRERNCARGTG